MMKTLEEIKERAQRNIPGHRSAGNYFRYINTYTTGYLAGRAEGIEWACKNAATLIGYGFTTSVPDKVRALSTSQSEGGEG